MNPLSRHLFRSASRWGVALSALGALSACSSLPTAMQPGRQLQASEVRQLFSGKTVTSRNLATDAVSVSYYSPDGRVRQQRQGRERLGTWRVLPNGQICLRMEREKESCRWMRQESDGRYQKYREAHAFARPVITYIGLKGPAASAAASRSSPSNDARQAGRSETAQVSQVQRLLNQTGFDAGPVDGIWGPKTVSAWQRFQAAQGLPRTHRIESLTLRTLSRHTASRR